MPNPLFRVVLYDACLHVRYLLMRGNTFNLFIPPPRNPKLVERYGIQDNKLILAVGRISSQERYKGFDDGTS